MNGKTARILRKIAGGDKKKYKLMKRGYKMFNRNGSVPHE